MDQLILFQPKENEEENPLYLFHKHLSNFLYFCQLIFYQWFILFKSVHQL